MKKIFFVLIILIFINENFAQACCTAGTPLLNSLEMSSAKKGILSFGLTGKYNLLTDVYDNSNFLENQERKRISNSYLLEITYGFTSRLSLSMLLSYVNNTRKITTINNLENTIMVSGIGDALLLQKYNIINADLFNRTELSAGIGIKLPLGSSTRTDRSILLPADMQPGTGSIDGLLWLYFSQGNLLIPEITFMANSSYRFNGRNKRFGNNQAGYKFGNEFIFTSGFTFSTDSFIDFTLLARFRNAGADKFGNQKIPNTGGNWLYLFPGLNFKLSDKLTTGISGEIPLYTNVIGTQLTTTFTASLSVYYSVRIIKGLEL